MDFTELGLVRIEAKDKEGEVLGHALALGQSFSELMHEQGFELPDSVEKLMKFTVETVIAPTQDVRKEVLERFKGAEVDTTPRDIDEEDLPALLTGLSLMESFSKLQFKDRLANASIAGRNGRAAFIDHAPQAQRYRSRIIQAVNEDKLRAFGLD
ncbi:MAG TPA: hypothetical protein VFW77_02870 [Candidatus Saccharimonadales bacterium]|nr:hypothetical protein [Candidatus Saccharimonadales bacterium]